MDTNLIAVRRVLSTRSYFKTDGSKDMQSLNNLNNATDLENLIIKIQKTFKIESYNFKYNSKKEMFVRIGNQEKTEDYDCFEGCKKCELQCFKSEYTVEEFLKLCGEVFKPVSIILA